jgi:hypothetical protein
MDDLDTRHLTDEPDLPEDEAAEICYSLTALGEAVVSDRRGRPFRGFGPCFWATAVA